LRIKSFYCWQLHEDLLNVVNLNPTNQQKQKAVTTTNRELRLQNLLGMILVSVLIHSLGLLLYAMFQPSKTILEKKSASKPIDFVVVPAPESEAEVPPQIQEQNTDNSEETPPAEPKAPPVSEPTPPPTQEIPSTVPPVSEVVPETPVAPETPVVQAPA